MRLFISEPGKWRPTIWFWWLCFIAVTLIPHLFVGVLLGALLAALAMKSHSDWHLDELVRGLHTGKIIDDEN